MQYKKAQPITIGQRTFKSKTAAKAFYQRIIDETKINCKVPSQFLPEVEALYAYRATVGKHVYADVLCHVVADNGARGRHFAVLRKSAPFTPERWSMQKTINGKVDTLKDKIKAAQRAAIRPYNEAFKKRHFTQVGIDGIDDIALYHVDHEVPLSFETISNSWVEHCVARNMMPDDTWVIESRQPAETYRFVDLTIEQDWINFHEAVCDEADSRRVVHRSVNLSAEAKETTPLVGWPL